MSCVVKRALENGKTTALFQTGGTEQRGPQNVGLRGFADHAGYKFVG